MPSRWMREGYLSSERINALSDGAEVLYVRLLLIVDDYGHYWADPTAVRVGCFPAPPLRGGGGKRFSVRRTKSLLAELEKKGLIKIYEVEKRKYLEVLNWKINNPRRARFPFSSGKENQFFDRDERTPTSQNAQTLHQPTSAEVKKFSNFASADVGQGKESAENSREKEQTDWQSKIKRQSNANRTPDTNKYIRQRCTHTLSDSLVLNKNPSNRVIGTAEKSENKKMESPAVKIFSDAVKKYPRLNSIDAARAVRLYHDYPGADFARCLEETAAILEADTTGRMNAYITLRREMAINERDAIINAERKGKGDKPLEERSVWELKTLLELAQNELTELQQYADPPDERLKDREPRYYQRSLKRHEEYQAAKKRVKKLKSVLLSRGGG